MLIANRTRATHFVTTFEERSTRLDLQSLEEGKYCCIDLLGALLLYPVTTARKGRLAEVGDELLHAFDPSAHPRYLQGGILVAP